MCLSNILSPVFMFAFIFHCRSFSSCWPLAFLIVSQLLWIFMFFFLQNSSLLFSTTRSCSFFQITSMLLFFLSKSPGGHAIFSKQNVELHLGFHTCWSNYFTLVCLRCRRTVGRSVYGHVVTKFSRMGSLPHFFTLGAPLRELRAGELRYHSHYSVTESINFYTADHFQSF